MGYRKGLVGVAFRILSFILSLIIVLFLYKPVSQIIIDKTNWDENLAISIQDKLTDVVVKEDGTLSKKEDTNISDVVMGFIEKLFNEALTTAKTNAITFVSGNLAIIMIRYGTMVVLFVISNILVSIFRSVVEFIANLPIIRLFNKSGGIIYGVIKGFLIVYLILALFSIISPLISQWGIIKAIQDAFLGSRMYNNNVILKFIMGK